MPGKFHRKVFCIIEDSSMDVRRIIGNIRKHGGGVERDPFSPIITHIILPLSQHNVTIVIDRLDSNSHARTVNNIVWTFGYREQDGRQFAPIRSGPMLVDAGWVKAAAMSREYTCRITARLRSPRPQEPRTPPRQPSRMQTGLAARISQSSAPVWPLPNKDRTASPVNTATPDLYSATGTTHDLARRISAPTAPFDLSIARSRVGVSAPTDPASDLPNNRPTREADHAPAPPTQPCLSASYVPRTRLPACTQPEPTMTTAPMVPNFHDKSRDPRLNRSIPTATDNSTSSVLVPPSPTPSHAADTEMSTYYLPAVGATDHPRDTPTDEEARVAAVTPTAGIPTTPPLPRSDIIEDGSVSGASATIRDEDSCDTFHGDVQIKTEYDERDTRNTYQSMNEEEDKQHPAKRRRVSEPATRHSPSRIEGAASPSSLDILDSSSVSPHPAPAPRRGTPTMPKPDRDGDNGAPNTQTSCRRDTLAEGSHSSGMSVERDLDALSIQRTPVSVLRPGADDIRLSSGATPTRAIKRRATNDGEDQPQEERVDPYIGIRRSLADLGLSVHLAAGHSVSLQILFDIASLPVSHSPEKAFFIVLPLPVDLDASAHVDANTKDLTHMVQRRGMGFAVSYRWLEECFREGRLLSPAAWAVRV